MEMASVARIFVTNLLFLSFTTKGSAPISDFEDDEIPSWYPYNLIETDVSCYKVGVCPMFPPGGELSVFPNSEEKFQHALHNMHRMHKNPNATDIINVDITKWFNGGWATSTYAAYYTGGDYCGTGSSIRHPLYWYSDANAGARLKAWDENTCISLSNAHLTCNNAQNEIIWSSNGNINIPTNRCSLFGDNCDYGSRSAAMSTENDDNKGEKPWFADENICGGNSCFKDSHCNPIFASYNDYVGIGFVEGMNGVTHQYSRATPEIQYELPIGAHYDDRMTTKPSDRDGTNKHFALILQYFHDTIPASKCWALYQDTATEMSILLDDITGSGRSQYFRSKFIPPNNCRPYKFICKKADGSYVKLPEEDTYFFGTQMMEWGYTLKSNDGVDGVPGVSLADLSPGYDCDEQHYYFTGTQWIVNGGPNINIQNDIYYYHNGGTCRGCQYIQILQCYQTCIESGQGNINNCNCDTPTPTSDGNTPSPITTATTASPVTASPTTASPITASPTTASPTTAPPTTASPITASPTTASPTTASPTTASPTTALPTTASPITASPTTASPTTTSPTTASPSTSPTTASPTTASPTTASPTPDGYTCIDVINYEQVFNRVRTWDEASDAGTYLGTCEEDFQAIYPLCGEWNSDSMEYYYYFIYERKGTGGRKSKLYVYMRICCGDGSTFGPNYVIESDINNPYQANAVLINRYQPPQALNSDDSWTNPSKWEWKHYLVYTIMALIVLCCIMAGLFLIKRHIARKNSFALTMDDYYPDKARGSKRNIIMDHTIQMHGFSSKPGPKHVALPSNVRDSTDGSTDGFTTHIANKYDSTDGSQDYGVNTMLTPPMQKLGHAVLPSVSIDTPETNPVDTVDLEEPPMFNGLPPPVPIDAIPNNVEQLNHDDITNAFE